MAKNFAIVPYSLSHINHNACMYNTIQDRILLSLRLWHRRRRRCGLFLERSCSRGRGDRVYDSLQGGADGQWSLLANSHQPSQMMEHSKSQVQLTQFMNISALAPPCTLA